MAPIFAIPYMILNVIWFFIVAHFIMSWLISFNVLNSSSTYCKPDLAGFEPYFGSDLLAYSAVYPEYGRA